MAINLFKMQDMLKNMSKDQLVAEAQNPTGTAPAFMVHARLAEVGEQEKEASRNASAADTTTVAQDVVQGAGIGGIGAMSQAFNPRAQNSADNGAFDPRTVQDTTGRPAEPVRMADGGEVGGETRGRPAEPIRMAPGGEVGGETRGRGTVLDGIVYELMPDGTVRNAMTGQMADGAVADRVRAKLLDPRMAGAPQDTSGTMYTPQDTSSGMPLPSDVRTTFGVNPSYSEPTADPGTSMLQNVDPLTAPAVDVQPPSPVGWRLRRLPDYQLARNLTPMPAAPSSGGMPYGPGIAALGGPAGGPMPWTGDDLLGVGRGIAPGRPMTIEEILAWQAELEGGPVNIDQGRPQPTAFDHIVNGARMTGAVGQANPQDPVPGAFINSFGEVGIAPDVGAMAARPGSFAAQGTRSRLPGAPTIPAPSGAGLSTTLGGLGGLSAGDAARLRHLTGGPVNIDQGRPQPTAFDHIATGANAPIPEVDWRAPDYGPVVRASRATREFMAGLDEKFFGTADTAGAESSMSPQDRLGLRASPGGIDSLPVTAAPRTSPDVNPRHLPPEERRARLGAPPSFGMQLPSQPPPRTSEDIDRDIADATRAAERDPTGATFDRLRSLAAERDAQYDTPPEVFVNRWNGERDVFAEEGPGAAGAVFDATDPEAGPTLATPEDAATPDATTPVTTTPTGPAGPSTPAGPRGPSGGIAGVAAPATAEGALSTYDQMLADALAENESDRAQAKWLLLAEIGAGMLGSTEPGFAGTGQAISAGLGSYTDAKDALKAEAMGIAGLAEDQRRYEQNRADQFAMAARGGSSSGAARRPLASGTVNDLMEQYYAADSALASMNPAPGRSRSYLFGTIGGDMQADPLERQRNQLTRQRDASAAQLANEGIYVGTPGTPGTPTTGNSAFSVAAP